MDILDNQYFIDSEKSNKKGIIVFLKVWESW